MPHKLRLRPNNCACVILWGNPTCFEPGNSTACGLNVSRTNRMLIHIIRSLNVSRTHRMLIHVIRTEPRGCSVRIMEKVAGRRR